MSGSAVPGTPAPPLTRRQLREAERAAEAARLHTALEVQRADEAARMRAAEEAVAHSRARLRAAEEAARLRAAEESAAQTRAAAERAAAQAAAERAAQEQAVQERKTRRRAAEKAAAERAAAEQAAAEKVAAEKVAAERAAAEKAAAERAAAEKAAAERAAAERAAAEQVAAERAAAERAAAEQVAAERAAAERAAAERAVAERAAAPQTRRARAAKVADVTAGALATAPDTAPTAETPADIPTAADQTPTEVLVRRAPSGPPASRRALREQSTRPAAPQRRSRGWAPRAAVLGTLGALTIVGPLTGLAGADEVASASQTVATQASLLEHLDAAAAAAALVAPDGLLADRTAASRAALMQTSRANERHTLTCAPLDGANGVRAAVTDRESAVIMPVAAGAYRLSSSYGFRNSPFTGYSKHLGEDFAAPKGTPIYAVADGTVEYVGVGKDGRSSMLVILKHEIDGETFYTWHVHMYPDGIRVTEGQTVRGGDVIAEVGSNGNSTGPHLHFEVHTDTEGTTIDPLTWLEEHGAVDVSARC
ncbi:M23 family metallopeptidase [Georgenia yuyongxinii]|uniref:M23 family metallopeptidase n=1 Tax=Georgenia yuyongxinii TaxID=2589797 RepID=A0A5B8C7S4_9MICO|nr:M23 family metallopeptidase [Georgenia yuyongxinii]QDC25501.1 M23 family metallopeptidase [Georgenia yuyongxinii]